MIELAADQQRYEARQELMMLRALRLAVPACFDTAAGRPLQQREAELLALVNGPGAQER